jgi:hypothetical protein
MTPQERDLVAQLFDRLAALENNPRDPEAERTIAEGLRRAPHAIYALVQTVLVQDEALKAANTRIEELEEALGPEPEPGRQPGGFLDSMRGALFGRRDEAREEPRGGAPSGSVPSVPPGGPWGAGTYRGGPPGPMPGAPPPAGGFLGTAAATAAGMIGGGLLLGGIRSMLGGQQHSPAAAALDHLAAGPAPSGGQGSDDLARQAGLGDIGRGAAGRSSSPVEPARDEKSDDEEEGGDNDDDNDNDDDDDNGDDDDGDDDDSDT